jgi:hypothetical protein
MRSVADRLRDEDRQRMLAMTPAERLELSLRLGERDLTLYCAAHGVSRADARLQLQRNRQKGRNPSRAAER